MNKALILKYKTEFDYWLNGGNVQAYYIKDSKPNWITDEKCIEYRGYDNFSRIIQNLLGTNDVLIVIDDEYVELRKAGADGKQLQVSYDNGKIWYDKSYKKISWSSSQLVRIKPEEPKFKVGDWIVNSECPDSPFQVSKYWLDHIINTGRTIGGNTEQTGDLKNFRPWQPQLGEWCWFYKGRPYNTPCLRKFITVIDDTYIALNSQNSKHITPTEVPSFKKGISDSYVTYKNCEPFIGQLPSYLKE